MLRQRAKITAAVPSRPLPKPPPEPIMMDTAAEPLLPSAVPPPPSYIDPVSHPQSHGPSSGMGGKTPWLVYAVASGACAAFNGVFAKLTTTELTATWASALSTLVGLSGANKAVEFLIRAMFFSLNLTFNGIMWAFFTKALTRATSTTRVAIVNTSSNFMLTALLGLLIFRESLPPLWWAGAALLVVGNVVIGRREEEEDKSPAAEGLLVVEGREFRDMDGDLGREEVVLKLAEDEGGEGVK